jgi:hypothetical protein
MELPVNINLPYVAYGLFKPNELAYNQVSEFVEELPSKIQIVGSLYIRDGLPLFTFQGSKIIIGYLIKFRKLYSSEAYRIISQFEPEKHYKWGEAKFDDTFVNILIGRSPTKASVLFDETEWSSSKDPIFNECLKVISDVVADFARAEFQKAPPYLFDWERLFKLQMGYLLLWTVIERFCSLSYGPALEPEEKIRKLGQDEDFKYVLKQTLKRKGIIYDCRDPGDSFKLNADNPLQSIKYYRQVRNNLSHRGKAAWKDGEIIRLSFVELGKIIESLLNKKFHKN